MSELSFGFAIPQGWRNDLPDGSSLSQFEYSKNIAIIADKTGYDAGYVYDHFVPHYNYKKDGNFFECFVLLSSLSSYTHNLKLGQIVTCNSYRNPALLAKMLATLDVATNGRIEFGIGAGWYEQEYLSYGYNYPSNIVRIEQLDESVQIIKKLWKSRNVNFSGKYYSLKDAISFPHPIQEPHPPIIIGGSGEKQLLRVAAKHADIYNLYFGTPEEMKRKIEKLKDHCNVLGRKRKPRYSIVLPCLISEEHEEIIKELKKKNREINPEKYKNSLAGGYTIGTPEEIIEGIRKYIDIGVSHFIFHFIKLDEKTLRLFYSKVIRKFK